MVKQIPWSAKVTIGVVVFVLGVLADAALAMWSMPAS
jgi:hypothetical protein